MTALPLVIVNPVAAGGKTAHRWPAMASAMRAHFGPFECTFTEAPGHATGIAEREARAGRRLIIACGGDGTVSEVVNGIVASGEPSELGVLPSGTGGDFRRTLGIPARASAAAAALRGGKARRIDLGRVTYVNGAGDGESRYFLNVASFGLSGEVVRSVAERAARRAVTGAIGGGLLSGAASYAIATLRAWPRYTAPAIELEMDGDAPVRLLAANICIANARYFGGGMKIAPTAEVDDGQLDVVAIRDMGTIAMIARSPRLYFGTHLRMDGVHHRLASRITVRRVNGGALVALEVDGELVGRVPATFEVVPGALWVRWPQAPNAPAPRNRSRM
ncbi:MAG: diacylglycerol/lipid kinase family protein [Gemmatimonadaceae bacterium]